MKGRTLTLVSVACTLINLLPSTEAKCVAIDVRATDEWCTNNGCQPPEFCKEEPDSPVSNPVSSPVSNPVSSPVSNPVSSPVSSPVSNPDSTDCNRNEFQMQYATLKSDFEASQLQMIQINIPTLLPVKVSVEAGSKYGLEIESRTSKLVNMVVDSLEKENMVLRLAIQDSYGNLQVTDSSVPSSASNSQRSLTQGIFAGMSAFAVSRDSSVRDIACVLLTNLFLAQYVQGVCIEGLTITLTLPSDSKYNANSFETKQYRSMGGTVSMLVLKDPLAPSAPPTPMPTPGTGTSPTTPVPTNKPNTPAPTPTPPPTTAGGGNTVSAKVYSELSLKKTEFDTQIFLTKTPAKTYAQSTLYRFDDMLKAIKVMHETGAGGMKMYLGFENEGPNAFKYGLVNIAAFIAQSRKETIEYDACDENSWASVVVGGKSVYPSSNSCGQLGQDYQNYKCDASEKHMECTIDPNMAIKATSNAKWWGAPEPLFCGPKSQIPVAGYWDPDSFCPNDVCTDYPGQQGGAHVSTSLANANGRTDVEGCCWWGRGVIQTTGPCNIGKLNYYLGIKAAQDGRGGAYPTVNFCTNPGAICSSTEFPELKWIAGLFFWMSSLETFATAEFNYLQELKKFVDGGMQGTAFIDAASGIVNRGCPRLICPSGEVDGHDDRRAFFADVLVKLGLKVA